MLVLIASFAIIRFNITEESNETKRTNKIEKIALLYEIQAAIFGGLLTSRDLPYGRALTRHR